MKLLRLFALLLMPILLLGAFPALAQDVTPEPDINAETVHRDPLQILKVTTAITDSGLTLSVRGATAHGCGEPQVEILENADGLVVIDLYTQTPEGLRCASGFAEQTVEIPLETAIPEIGLTVDINGVSYLINPDGTFGPAFTAPVTINDLTLDVQENSMVISVVGEIDGCEVPVIMRRTVEIGAINLRIYRVLSAAMLCPMILKEYTAEVEIPLTGDEGGIWVISTNDREIAYDFYLLTTLAEADLPCIDAIIDSVQVNKPIPLPQQVTITVAGTHPDGCYMPTQVRQQFDPLTNTLNVRIYHVLPQQVRCEAALDTFTLIIPLDLEIYEGATYTINVNGTTVEAKF